MTDKIFEVTIFGAIAMEKIGSVPSNFRLFYAGWIGNGDPAKSTVMKVTGAEFREPKTGPNRGRLTIKIKGTDRTVYVSREEMRARHVAGNSHD